MADEETTDETKKSAASAETDAPEAAEPEAAAAEPEVVEPEAEAEEPAAAEPAAAEPAPEEPAAGAEPAPEAATAAEAEPAAEPEPAAAEPEPAAAEAAPAAADPAPAAEPEAEPAPPAVSGPKKKRKRLPRALRHKHSKPERASTGERKPITRTPKPDSQPGRRQERRGIVVSDKGDKTIVVKVETIRIHAKYKKVVRRSNKLHAHDESNTAGVGDVVRVVETRPLSKTKRWRLAEIVEKAR